MKFSRWLTLALSLCIVAVGVAIVWSFMSRRQQVVTLPEAEILSPEISRQSTQFEYTEHKRGRPVFTVNAATSTQTMSDVHTLNEVKLAYFDQADEPSDSITGRVATYSLTEKELDFAGDIRIWLADGTEVVSEHGAADLIQEVAKIDQGFQFQRGNITGNGGSLRYSFPQREMRVAEGLTLVTSSGGRQFQATAREGIYRLSEQEFELLNGAGISSGDAQLKADRIGILPSGEYQIGRILSSGQARLQAGPVKVFSGSRINILFDLESDGLDKIEIFGGPTTRAVYSQEVGDNRSVLEAATIVVVPDSTRISDRVLLKTFIAQEEVLLRSPAAGISEARSDELEGEFFEDGEHLRQLDLRGQVSILQKSLDREPHETWFRSRKLRLQFDLFEILQEARAEGDVELILTSAEGDEKRLVAKDFVQVSYNQGVPDRIVSSGECQIESITAEGRDRVQAPRVEVHYQQGLLDKIVAEAGVRVESLHQGKISYTTSDRLEVVYLEGFIEAVVQSGNFRFWDGVPTRLDLRSDRATFDPGTGKIVATGTQPSVLRTIGVEGKGPETVVETRAQRFELDREGSQVFAEGEVRSSLSEGGNYTRIHSGSMKADRETGWVEYTADPSIILGDNTIRGKIVRYNHPEQRLIVETDVVSTFSEGASQQRRQYSIESDRLVYNRQDLRARYEGQVRLETQDLILMAPFMDVTFSDEVAEKIQEIVAWGGVQIFQEDRKAEGDRAVHYPLQDKVILTGDPAQVVELESGKVAGRRLTFYLGDETILVEGHSASVTP
ncbi:MAG: LptA/OstA family protein [Acidobacteriota bacterium]|nr:LptA/OstA family protein [Acidobacteriota bacterium]